MSDKELAAYLSQRVALGSLVEAAYRAAGYRQGRRNDLRRRRAQPADGGPARK